MNPVAFTIFGLSIRWYAILIVCGMLIGILIANFSCKFRNVNYDNLLNIIIIAIPCGVIGARLYYVLLNSSYYISHASEIINTRQGGLAIHGGIIFALLSVFIYTRQKKIGFFEACDVSIPSVVLAQAIGRWGNFLNQEAHGGEVSVSFIKHFPAFIQKGMYINGSYYHPTFLYESIWDLCIFIILMLLLKKSRKKGIVLFTYIGLYSLGRFFIEGLRTDSLMLGPIRAAQLVSIIGIIIFIFSLVYYRRRE